MDHQNQEGAFWDNLLQWQGSNWQNISAPRKNGKKQEKSDYSSCHSQGNAETIERGAKDWKQCQSRREK